MKAELAETRESNEWLKTKNADLEDRLNKIFDLAAEPDIDDDEIEKELDEMEEDEELEDEEDEQ